MNDDTCRDQNPEPEQTEQPREQHSEPEVQQSTPPPPPPPPPGYYHPQYVQFGQAQQPRRNGWLIPVSLAVGCLPWGILFLIILTAMVGAMSSGPRAGEHVALVQIVGQITGGKSGSGPFSGTVAGSETIVRQMEEIRENDKVKAVVIRINSPGGSAAGSEEIYNEIRRLQESGKIVYASMGDVAASGGYYIASACDRIYANSNTLTGSIGVIFSLADLSSLYKKIGYRAETIKAGKYKDIGSPDRPLTAEERAMLQALVDDTYTTFVGSVAKGRKMSVEQVREVAEGRIYTGTQAAKVKLVDEIGGLRETIRAAAAAGGIEGEPEVIEYGDRGFLDAILSSESSVASEQLTDAVRRELIKKLLQSEGELKGLR